MDVFDTFPEAVKTYTFLEISRGEVYGNRIVNETDAGGIFKFRDGMTMSDNQESRESQTTLKIRPDETFVTTVGGKLVGHGIRYDGVDYEIIGSTGGDNYDDGEREHIRLTLQVTDFSDYGESVNV